DRAPMPRAALSERRTRHTIRMFDSWAPVRDVRTIDHDWISDVLAGRAGRGVRPITQASEEMRAPIRLPLRGWTYVRAPGALRLPLGARVSALRQACPPSPQHPNRRLQGLRLVQDRLAREQGPGRALLHQLVIE